MTRLAMLAMISIAGWMLLTAPAGCTETAATPSGNNRPVASIPAGPGSSATAAQAEAASAETAKLIGQLGSADFNSREIATAKLKAMGKPVEAILRRTRDEGDLDPEQIQRVNAVLDEVGHIGLKGMTTPGRLGIGVEVQGQTTYLFNQAQQGQRFRDAVRQRVLDDPHLPGGGFPIPPDVKLKLVLTNTRDTPLTIAVGGDEGAWYLEMNGPNPGPVFFDPPNRVLSQEKLKAELLTIKPGESASIPMWNLSYGRRFSNAAYFTEPGEYLLTVGYRTHTAGANGETLTLDFRGDPIKISVLASK